jgi:cytochrome b pre-mRNA-processing protein 3
MILPLFRRSSNRRSIPALYGAIVAQARSARFYADFGVPDTVAGRFDLIVLHLVLVLRRLGGGEGEAGHRLGQSLFDAFCRDLEGNLREMGTGDLAVPKRMRAFAEAFYGRQAAYLAALGADHPGDFEKALARNIFSAGEHPGAVPLAAYARAAARQLDAQSDAALRGGAVVFPNPEAFDHVRVQASVKVGAQAGVQAGA